MHALKMPIPQSKEEFTEILFETIRRSKLKRATVFCATTFGVFPLNFIDGKWGGPDWKPTLMIYCAPYYWQATFEKQEVGFKCMIPTIRNFPPQCLNPRIKNWDRLNYYLAVMEVKERGADTPIILDVDGYVTEAIGSNVWIVANGKLYTAAEDILYGITREVVFDIARLENIEAITARFTTFELYNADEAFLCSTTGGIMPVTEVDGRIIGSGKPGPITRQIKEKYWKLHVDPAYSTKVPGL
jgi:branched-chain amino acid aminotransferase